MSNELYKKELKTAWKSDSKVKVKSEVKSAGKVIRVDYLRKKAKCIY